MTSAVSLHGLCARPPAKLSGRLEPFLLLMMWFVCLGEYEFHLCTFPMIPRSLLKPISLPTQLLTLLPSHLRLSRTFRMHYSLGQTLGPVPRMSLKTRKITRLLPVLLHQGKFTHHPQMVSVILKSVTQKSCELHFHTHPTTMGENLSCLLTS